MLLTLRNLISKDANETNYEIEREMTFTELFYDLIFVTATAKMGEEWKGGEWDVGVYVVYFLVVFNIWMGTTQYGTRFHSDDMCNKVYYGFQMMGMVGIVMCIPGSYRGDTLVPLACAFAFLRANDIVMYFRIARHFHRNPTDFGRSTGINRPRNFAAAKVLDNFIAFIIWCCVVANVIDKEDCLYAFVADFFFS